MRSDYFVTASIVQGLLVHEIRQAPSEMQQWKLLSPHTLIWHGASNDIGWYFTAGELKRIEGSYNQNNNTWKKKTTSIAIRTIAQGSFESKIQERGGKQYVTSIQVHMIYNPFVFFDRTPSSLKLPQIGPSSPKLPSSLKLRRTNRRTDRMNRKIAEAQQEITLLVALRNGVQYATW